LDADLYFFVVEGRHTQRKIGINVPQRLVRWLTPAGVRSILFSSFGFESSIQAGGADIVRSFAFKRFAARRFVHGTACEKNKNPKQRCQGKTPQVHDLIVKLRA
jgi:hypothetical protein